MFPIHREVDEEKSGKFRGRQPLFQHFYSWPLFSDFSMIIKSFVVLEPFPSALMRNRNKRVEMTLQRDKGEKKADEWGLILGQ